MFNRVTIHRHQKVYFIRALTRHDVEKINNFYNQLSPESIYLRYFHHKKQLTDKDVAKIIDNGIGLFEMNWRQFNLEGDLIGIAELHKLSKTSGEFAIALLDRYHRKGLAKYLSDEIKTIAKWSGITDLKASYLLQNKKGQQLGKYFNRISRKVDLENGSVDDDYAIDKKFSLYDFFMIRKRK